MPDLGDFCVECNCCGKQASWDTRQDGAVLVKVVPQGWSMIADTAAGDVYFDSAQCERVWKNGREWQLPGRTVVIEERQDGMSPEGITVTDGEMCECGSGPFKDGRGIHGHQQSFEHKRRMGMDVSGMREPDRHKAKNRGRKRPKPPKPKPTYEVVS